MKVVFFVTLVLATQVDSQFWKYSQEFFNPFSWIRQGKTVDRASAPVVDTRTQVQTLPPIPVTITTVRNVTTAATVTSPPPPPPPSSTPSPATPAPLTTNKVLSKSTSISAVSSAGTVGTAKSNEPRSTTKRALKTKATTPLATTTIRNASKYTNPIWTTVPITTQTSTRLYRNVTDKTATATVTEATTMLDTTTQEVTGTTEEPRDNHRVHDFYLSKREKPQVKIASNISQNLLPLPAGASAALVKPTKYHYYPHNQHIYLLPECAIQQVCNAVYVRLNWTQPLCACPSRYRDPCSASLNSDDLHTTELMVDRNSKRALTLVKTCEPTTEMRICRAPRDWSLLALQNIRTGKSHYLVICRCSDTSILEGPMSHDQPTYASVPGIRVYGMMCVQAPNKRRGRPLRLSRSLENPPFPWTKAVELSKTIEWED